MQTPEELTEELKSVLKQDLKAVILYGSAAAGDRTRRYSDFNLLIVVQDPSVDVLRSVMPLLKRWRRENNPAPLFFAEDRFRAASDVFPIEFSDMKRQHRVLWGRQDLFNDIEVDRGHLRHQLEYELRSKLLLLRQAYLDSGGRATAIRPLLAHALSAFAVLFRTVLELRGESVPVRKPDVWHALAKHIPMDSDALDAIWRMRDGDREAERMAPDDLFARLMKTVETVVDFVDAQGPGGSQGRK